MSAKEEFHQYFRAAMTMSDNPQTRHPTEQDLFACSEGRLAAAERESIRTHLSECRACFRVYRDIVDFLDPIREGESALGEIGVRRAWNTFQQRMQKEDLSDFSRTQPEETQSPRQRLRVFWRSRFFPLTARPALALVATLLLTLGLTGGWALWLEREKQQLAQRLAAANTQATARLEEERRQWQAQAQDLKKDYESQLAALKEPQVNTTVYDVFPEGIVQRSGGPVVNQILVPAGTREFTLVLNGEGVPRRSQYIIEILRQDGQVLWHGEGLERDRLGSFFVRINRSFLTDGTYRLKIYGATIDPSQMLAEYRLGIRAASR